MISVVARILGKHTFIDEGNEEVKIIKRKKCIIRFKGKKNLRIYKKINKRTAHVLKLA